MGQPQVASTRLGQAAGAFEGPVKPRVACQVESDLCRITAGAIGIGAARQAEGACTAHGIGMDCGVAAEVPEAVVDQVLGGQVTRLQEHTRVGGVAKNLGVAGHRHGAVGVVGQVTCHQQVALKRQTLGIGEVAQHIGVAQDDSGLVVLEVAIHVHSASEVHDAIVGHVAGHRAGSDQVESAACAVVVEVATNHQITGLL